MRNTMYQKFTAVATAFAIAALPVTTVYAADQTVPTTYDNGIYNVDNVTVDGREGDQPFNAVEITNDATVNISGDVKVDASEEDSLTSAISVIPGRDEDWNPSTPGGTVNIDGNVEASGTYHAINAEGESTVNVEKNVTSESSGTSILAFKGADVSVGGNVDSESNAIEVWGGTVSVGGDVTVDGDGQGQCGILALDESTVHVNGNVTVQNEQGQTAIIARSGSDVTVDGKVTLDSKEENSQYAAIARADSTITIGDDVTSSKNGLSVLDGSTISVTGDVTAAKTAITIDNTSNITVDGNVEGGTEVTWKDGVKYTNPAISIALNTNNDNTGTIVVTGTLKSSADCVITIQGTSESTVPKDVVDQLPTIVVYQIEATEGKDIVNVTPLNQDQARSKEENHEIAQAVAEAINYIIVTEGGITLSGEDLGNNANYDTMKIGQTITATVGEGQKVVGSTSVTIEKVSDGVYNITLNSPNGGILLRAEVDDSKIEPANNEEQQSQNRADNNGVNGQQNARINNNQQNGAADNTAQQDSGNDDASSNTQLVATATTSDNAVVIVTSNSDTSLTPSTPGSEAPSRSVEITVSSMTSEQFQATIVDNISATPDGGTLRIETDTVATLDRAMLEAFAEKGTVDLEIVFTYNGQKLKVVIPKGYDINKLLDDKGYCGFLRLADILGSEVIG